MPLVTFVHTDKANTMTETTGELLGYKKIEVLSLEWTGRHFSAECMVTRNDGQVKPDHNAIVDIEEDIKNGYLKPA